MAPKLNRLVMVLAVGTAQPAVLHDVPGDSDGRPYQRHGAQHIDAVENQHRREDNKRAATSAAPDRLNRAGCFSLSSPSALHLLGILVPFDLP